MNLPFVYWKLPNQTDIFTIHNLLIKTENEPVISEEGFLFFPYNKSEQGFFYKGKIENTLGNLDRMVLTDKTTNANKNDSPEKVDSKTYKKLIETAIEEIKIGSFEKVVLARSQTLQLPKHFNLEVFYKLLCQNYTNALVYCIGLENEIWIGATPELLIKKENSKCLTYALAGTKSEFAFGKKEQLEQQLVKNYIVNLLKIQECTNINVSEIMELNTGNLTHLINEIVFETSNPKLIITNLHPTPAVCGTPMLNANDFIIKNENLARQFYTGYLGPIMPNNEFSFWVNLRCAKIQDNQITFYSGAGITEDSIANHEFNETERKMDTLRMLINKTSN